ncbi:unnamed protein product [Mytilus coruscus]|uniref:MEGF10_11 n=1 Tax=Mytilus coruscus TaxID=42192 RepID=A0A6J8B0H6_MYTCO|nr:unnamed protein product [Mytilus coruscus]
MIVKQYWKKYAFRKTICVLVLECPVGFTTHPEEAVCKPCSSNFFGYRCIEKCSCTENERCNHIDGCVKDETDQHHTTEPTTQTTVFSVFPNRESIIYIGSIGLMAFIICSLIAYICYKKNRKRKSFDKNKSHENPLVHWHSEHKNTDENEYAEIEETFLYNIKTATRGVKVRDKEVNNDCNRVNKDNFMNGYLNPYQPIISTEGDVHQYSEDNITTSADNHIDSGYLNPYQPIISTEWDVHQYSFTMNDGDNTKTSADNHSDSGNINPYQPIISTEVDVHQYSSTMNDGDNATTSADNQKDSGYLNPHQSLTLDTLENKHVYNELKTRITKKDTEIQKFSAKDGEDKSDFEDECILTNI